MKAMKDREIRKLADLWAGEDCSLNGRPARITGRLNRFARVVDLEDFEKAAEFSWETVDRVMRGTKDFFMES